MSYTVDWYPGHEGRIIQETLAGQLSIEDVAAAAEQVVARMRLADPPAHVYIDLHHVESFPLWASQIKDAAVYLRDPKLGLVVLAGGTSLMETFAGMIGQLSGVKLRTFPSEEEALAFLQQEDRSLAR